MKSAMIPKFLSSLLVPLVTITVTLGAVSADESASSKNEIGALIEQLGSESYASRVRAMERLQRMGLEAFDELHLAQTHPDIEIEMAARYLVSSLLVSWSKESDPPEVREALHEYGAQDEPERQSRIELLAEFANRKGLEALVRLTRFEMSLRLSRRAALTIMEQTMSEEGPIRRRNSEKIFEVLGKNDRHAAQWLRVYADELAADGYTADRWQKLIATERQQIDAAVTGAASRNSVLELVRICATRAASSGEVDEALRLARQNLDLIEPTTRDLIDACTWAIDHDLHPFVLDLRERHTYIFDQQPILLYGAAEAKSVAGDSQQADQLAELALEIRPLPTSEDEKKKMSPNQIEEIAHAHREIGRKLRERGLFQWAEREFRQIIDSLDMDMRVAAGVRADLAEMLAELLRHEEVVEVLKPLVERVENDDQLKQRLNEIMFRYNRFRSEVEFHGAMAKIRQGNVDEARPMMERALRLYPQNIDILIAMYRTEGDARWTESVQSELRSTIARSETEVKTAKMQARNNIRGSEYELANSMNQYAWLVANTEGDYAKALEYSLQSVEIDPSGANYDTCGRCYFAIGDFHNAVRMQKRALKFMPHSPPLVRQLQQFETALEKENQKAAITP